MIAVVMLVAVISSSQGPAPSLRKDTQTKQKQTSGEHTKAAPDAPDKTPATSTTATVHHPESDITVWNQQITSERGDYESANEWRFPWSPITCFTAVLTVATLGLVVVGIFQARYMQAGLRETTKAANAATKSANTAENALKVLERAEVLLEQIELRTPLGAAVDLTDPTHQKPRPLSPSTICTVWVKNYGHSTAGQLVFKCSLSAQFAPVGEQPLITIGVPFKMAAGAHFDRSFPALGRSFSDQTIAQMNNGSVPLTLEANIRYDDVFGAHYNVIGWGFYNYQSGAFELRHTDPDKPGREQ